MPSLAVRPILLPHFGRPARWTRGVPLRYPLDVALPQLVYIEALGCFHSLRPSLRLDAEVELRDDEGVVCPTLRAAHRLSDSYVLPVLLPDDDIVNIFSALGFLINKINCTVSFLKLRDVIWFMALKSFLMSCF